MVQYKYLILTACQNVNTKMGKMKNQMNRFLHWLTHLPETELNDLATYILLTVLFFFNKATSNFKTLWDKLPDCMNSMIISILLSFVFVFGLVLILSYCEVFLKTCMKNSWNCSLQVQHVHTITNIMQRRCLL